MTHIGFLLPGAQDNEEHINSTYFINRDTMPRLMVLDKSSGTRAFAVDSQGDTASQDAMRAFLIRTLTDSSLYEYEGHWGMPARWWRKMKQFLPFLSMFDFLPRYSISSLWCAVAFTLLMKLIFLMPSFPEDDDVPTAPPAGLSAPQKKKMAKAD